MKEKIQQELQALVDYAHETAKHTQFYGINYMNAAGMENAFHKYQGFETRALNLIRRALGTDSDHYQALQRLGERLAKGVPEFTEFSACLGIV